MSLLAELKRRNVFRVAAAYVVLSWLMLQAGDILFEALGLPDWTMRMVVALLAIGFIPAVVFSWVYELTPDGVKKESEIDRSGSVTPETGKKLNYITIGMVVLGVGIVALDRFVLPENGSATDSVVAEVGFEGDRAASGSVPGDTPAEAATPESTQKSIAVLPFADLSPEGDQEYFSDGIAEEILNVLVRIDELKVASRTSAFAYKGANQSITEIASALKVDHVLEGSVRKAGNRVRITAQLIDASKDRHLWSETFDRELTDIFAIQDEIANAIVTALTGALGNPDGPGSPLIKASTSNLNAYELFLKGRQMFLARDRLDLAIEILRQAVNLDPEFARAWEVLAALYSVAPSWGIGDESEYNKLSDQAADEALRLDSERYFTYAIKAQNMFYRSKALTSNFEQMIALNQRAIAGNPKDPTPYLWSSIYYRVLGFTKRARQDLNRCLELDPAYENCRNHMTFSHLANGEMDLAFAWLDRHLTEVPVRHNILFPYFVPEMLRRGEIRLAYLLADAPNWNFDGDARPIHLWLDGLQHPEEDQTKRIESLENWSATHRRGMHDFVWATLGAYDHLKFSSEYKDFFWRPDLRDYRATDNFKRMMQERGIVAYWQKHGFPPRCRSLAGDDFECD